MDEIIPNEATYLKGNERLLQDQMFKNWFKTKKYTNAYDIYEKKYEDTKILSKLHDGHVTEVDGSHEFESNLLFSGIDLQCCSKIAQGGKNFIEYQDVVDKLSPLELKSLDGVKKLLNDKRYNDAGLHPTTLLTEHRRKTIFHALLNTNDIDVTREGANKILEQHMVKKNGKPWFSMGVELEETSLQSRIVLENTDFPVSVIDTVKDPMMPVNSKRADRLSTQSIESYTNIKSLKNSNNKNQTNIILPKIKTYNDNDQCQRKFKKQEQCFHPQWEHYDVMKARWKSIRPK